MIPLAFHISHRLEVCPRSIKIPLCLFIKMGKRPIIGKKRVKYSAGGKKECTLLSSLEVISAVN